jgi:hypothetical protein
MAGTEALSAWAAKNVRACAAIAETKSADIEIWRRALEHVEAFLAERRLPIYGGLAIDIALKLAGHQGLYGDGALPDYDVYSPDAARDAYALADRLSAARLPDVGALPAIHATTMRVKVDFIFVADITYVPAEILADLPTVQYRGMQVVHPNWQRLDLHLALSFPFTDQPRPPVEHRWARDVERFNRLDAAYPIDTPASLDGPLPSAGGCLEGGGGGSRAGGVVELEKVALHGFAAYGLLLAALEALLAETGGGAPPAVPSLPVEVARTGGANQEARVTFTAPAGGCAALEVATPFPEAVAAALLAAPDPVLDERARFAPYLDLRPAVSRFRGSKGGGVAVYELPFKQLAVCRLRAASGAAVTIVTPQFLLLDLLLRAQIADSAAGRALYVTYYRATLAILAAGDSALAELAAVRGTGAAGEGAAFHRLVAASPFGLTVQTLGGLNLSPAYMLRLCRSASHCGDTYPVGLDSETCLPGVKRPATYYPARGTPPPTFDYSEESAYQLAGQETSGAGTL